MAVITCNECGEETDEWRQYKTAPVCLYCYMQLIGETDYDGCENEYESEDSL